MEGMRSPFPQVCRALIDSYSGNAINSLFTFADKCRRHLLPTQKKHHDISLNCRPTFQHFGGRPITASVINVSHAHPFSMRPIGVFWLTWHRQEFLSVGKCEWAGNTLCNDYTGGRSEAESGDEQDRRDLGAASSWKQYSTAQPIEVQRSTTRREPRLQIL